MKKYELTEDMASEPQWLDAPTRDGWWWFADMAGDVSPVRVNLSSHYWSYTVVLDGKVINDHGGWETKSGAINSCREQYGIEPTVIE